MLGRKTLWSSQPQDAAPLAHSFHKSLIGVAHPFGAYGRARTPQLGAASILSTGTGGIGLKSNGTATGHISLGANLSPPGFVCTMLCVFRFIPGTFSDLLSTDNSSSTNYIGHSFYANSTGAVGVLMGDGGVADPSTRRSIDTSSTPLIANAINTVAFAVDSNTTARIWVNGVLQSTTTSGSGTGYAPGTTGTASIGRRGQTTYTTADVLTIGIWSEAFNNYVLRELSREPWQLFESLNGTVPHYFATGQRIHYVVYPASESRYPQAQDVIDGWPDVATTTGYEASSSSSLVNFYVDAEGLADGTSYKIAYVWYDGNNVSDVVVSESFSTLSGAIALTAGNDTQTSTSATGVITQIHVLVGANSSQAGTSGTGSIASPINLTVGFDSQVVTSASASVTQVHITTVSGNSETNSSTTSSITQAHVPIADNSAQAGTSANVAVTQVHVTTAASCSQASTSTSAVITLAQALAGSNSTEANTSSTGSISQVHVSIADNCNEANTSTTNAITQVQVLVGSDSTQNSTSATGIVTGAGTLVGAPASQANTSNSVVIILVQTLTVSAVSQASTTSSASISQAQILVVSGDTGNSTSGNVAVSVGSGLAGSSCSQAGTSANAVITQTQTLSVSGCNSTNNSSTSDIAQVNNVSVSSDTQTNTSIDTVLTQVYALAASSCLGISTSSSVLIEQIKVLAAANCVQDSTSLAAAVAQVHVLLANISAQGNNSSSVSLATSFYRPGTVIAQNEPRRLFITSTRDGVFVTVENSNKFLRATG